MSTPTKSDAPVREAVNWLENLAVYADRRVWLVGVLGFSSGLPLLLTLSTLAARMVDSGMSKTTVGLFALVGLPYSLKFIWAPLMDQLRLPLLYGALGRRRSWLILCQCWVILGIVGLAQVAPADGALPLALWALFLAFASASQDIVIDAYRVEVLDVPAAGAGAATLVAGYRVGMLVGGAGALYFASFWDWQSAYYAMAACMLIGIAAVLVANEPPAETSGTELQNPKETDGSAPWWDTAVVAPFRDFMRRPAWLMILLFVCIYKLGDGLAGIMAIPFYLEIGFSKTDIASVAKLFGLFATLLGGFLGGLLVARYALSTALIAAGVGQMISNLMFVLQDLVGPEFWFLAITVGVENITGGMGTAAFVAYLSSLCARAYTAVQYALLSALMSVTRTMLTAPGGWLAEEMSWSTYFLLSTVAALPGLWLLVWLRKRGPAW